MLLPGLEGASKPIRFHGYYFHILSNPGGEFAAIAYPTLYRSSGVKTFIVTQDGGMVVCWKKISARIRRKWSAQ